MSVASVDAVVLAAGEATRAGDFKLGWPVGGTPMLVRLVQTFQAVADRVIVVTGHEPDRVRALLSQAPDVALVHNDRHADGMFTSVQAGLGAADGDFTFLTPGDIPLIRPEVLRAMLAAHGRVRVPVMGNRGGHPVLMDRAVRDAVLAEPASSTLRDVLNRFERTRVPVQGDGILLDIDTPSDYNEVKERYEQDDF